MIYVLVQVVGAAVSLLFAVITFLAWSGLPAFVITAVVSVPFMIFGWRHVVKAWRDSGDQRFRSKYRKVK
jgi:hypothetical protein